MQKQIMRLLRICFVYSMLVAIVGCSADAENYDLIDNLPVPDGAYDVKKLMLGTSNTQQLFFQIKESYPSISTLEIYRGFLQEHGWTLCTGSSKGWSSHEDRTSDPYILVHKQTDHWIHSDDSKLLILTAMYYSKDLERVVPDNDEQRLIVWVQRSSNLGQELSELDIECGEH